MEIARVSAAATSFIHRVKSKPQTFGHFCRIMKRYSSEKLDVRGVMSELDALFQSHHDLLTGYRIFLPPEFVASSPSLQKSRQSRKNNVINVDMLNPCIDFMNKVQKRFGDERGVIQAYLETVRALTQGKISNKDAYNAIVKIFGSENQDLVDGFELLLFGDNGCRKKIKKKKSVSPSNSNSNSGDEIRARKQKTLVDDLNLYNRMEDEMYELDVQLSCLENTVGSAKALRDSAAEEVINIDNYFRPVTLGFIRKEYKERGCSVIQQLRENPRHVVPQILGQLESRERELSEARKKLHEYWRGVHEKKQNSATNSSV